MTDPRTGRRRCGSPGKPHDRRAESERLRALKNPIARDRAELDTIWPAQRVPRPRTSTLAATR
jgi:hypothetical protein